MTNDIANSLITSLLSGNTDNSTMDTLKRLAEMGQVWKAIHKKYHPLGRDINKMLAVIADSSVSNHLGIAPAKLHSVFMECKTLIAAGNDLDVSLNSQLRAVRRANREVQNYLESLSNQTNEKIPDDFSNELKTICEQQTKFLKLHGIFYPFLNKLSRIKDTIWKESQVDYVYKNRDRFINTYPEIIICTDDILMALLTLHITTIDALKQDI